uniref:Apple domain-containing protein n=1 Tax=Plectus sambesii TaxID=2011161 RepID=A0A914VLW7_9BILA
MRSLLFALFAVLTYSQYAHGQTCKTFVKVLDNVYFKEDFGESKRKTVVASKDCQAACNSETTFKCAAFLWVSPSGDCILLDQISLSKKVLVTNSLYDLYVPFCGSAQAAPSIGSCKYEVTKSNVAVADGVQPGFISPSACQDLCVGRFRNIECTAFLTSPGNPMYSKCLLYAKVDDSDVKDGNMVLWTKVCSP